MPTKAKVDEPETAVATNTPSAIMAGMSVKEEPGLPWYHRFGPVVAFVLLVALQVGQEMGFIPELNSLEQVENVLIFLSGGWAARLGVTLPKKP